MRSLAKKLVERFLVSQPNFVNYLYFRVFGKILQHVDHVVVDLPKTCILGHTGEKLRTRLDSTLMRAVLSDFQWQLDEINFVTNSLKEGVNYDVIDVGANIGLFSLQLLNKVGGQIGNISCFEPDKRNFECLAYNLDKWQSQVNLFNFGLGEMDEIKSLYIDYANSGNYSLMHSAMTNKLYTKEEVRISSTLREMNELCKKSSLPLIWKSDTQGFDELILSQVPTAIWNRLHCGVIEIAGLPDVKFDQDVFFARLKEFDYISLNGKVGKVDLLKEFWRSKPKHHAELHFRR